MPAFLFTDLESSTRLWESHPEAMRGALARHDAILVEAVESAAGTVVKTTGDGLMAVFVSPAEALSASVGAQLALAAESWEATGPLRVRIGIHAGDAEPRGGDYYGPAVNRAARIMAAAHGGQVLISASAAELAAPLPPGVSLLDLGNHRLKDLTQPEHLFQVLHSHLGADFPPPVTLDARPNNLPIQGSEFFGRERELAAVLAKLAEPSIRLVTLTGPGGTGKTRLALQVAAELIDRYRDGVFFVDLSSERDPDTAYEAIARTLSLSGTMIGDPLQILRTQLRERRMLLVLDNMEQVADAATGVAELLQHCSGLEFLVTSREALRIRPEHLYPVPPLGLPEQNAATTAIAASEAVRLFLDRARAARPDFTIDDGNAAVIAEICIRLDGLPLAIELAAARLRVFSAPDLLTRLTDRLDVLGGGGRDLPARQRTLRGAIEWSYELLDGGESTLFEMLAVFTGASVDAIEEVAAAVGGGFEPVDALVSLVDKSLLRTGEADATRRFSMLHTIREFATERLGSHPGLESSVRRAHAEYYSRFAQGLRQSLQGPARDSAVDELAAEIGNLRTAWRFWVEQSELEQLYLLLDGLWALHDARGWYRAAMELAADLLEVLTRSAPSPQRDAEELTLRTSLARATMAVRGYTPEVEEAFRRALELSDAVGGSERYPVLRALATYYLNLADFAKGAKIGAELLALGESEDDDAIRVDGNLVFGANTAFSSDVALGLRHLDRAIELFDPKMHGSGRFRLGSSPGVVARIAAGLTRWQTGDHARAEKECAEALVLARELAHPFSIAYALYHTGFLAFNRAHFAEARSNAVELAAIAAENEYSIWGALATVLEGVAMCGLGDTKYGLAKTETGVDLYQGLTTPPVFWPLILGLRSFAHACAGSAARALDLIDEAIAVTGGEEAAYPEFRVVRGDLLRSAEVRDVVAAEASYRAAIRGARMLEGRTVELRATTRLVELAREEGLVPDGSDELRRVCDWFPADSTEVDVVEARTVLGIA